MKIEFTSSFLRDIEKLKDKKIAKKVKKIILECEKKSLSK